MFIKAKEIAHEIGCKRFIASGTVAKYVFSKGVINIKERQISNDIYGAAKVSAHYFLSVRTHQLNQAFNWVLIPSIFGERREDNNIITYTITSLLKGEKPSCGQLNQMWKFLYVAEVVRAL